MARRASFVLLLLVQVHLSTQQGLQYDPTAALRASGSYETLKAIYSKSKAFRQAYTSGSAASACNKNQGSLCSPYGQTYEQRATMLMSTSPQKFDARSSGSMGSFSAVAQPKDQGQCNSCVAFALLAAAQSAMACALKEDAKSSISEHDFFFCKSVARGEERTCGSSWSMRQGIEALIALEAAGKFPVTESCLPWNPTDPACGSYAYECQDVEPALKQGTFSYVKLESAWEMQEHIRNWGSVVTRLDVYSDFKPFFESRPAGTYLGHGPKATYVTSHAIQVVGYDLDSKPPAYLVKNSWGTGFAAGGFFRIAMGVDGVGHPDDTYGIKFKPFSPRRKPYNRLSSAGSNGCYFYKALPSDYISRVAYVFGSSPVQVLLDNKDIIKQPDVLLTDMTILLCGISPPPSGSTSTSTSTSQPRQPSTTTNSKANNNNKPQQPLQQQQQQQQQQQPKPVDKPAPSQVQQTTTTTTTSVVSATPGNTFATAATMGEYRGRIACEGFGMQPRMKLRRDANGGVEMELDDLNEGRAFLVTCDYHLKASCTSSSRGLCQAGTEPWVCRYHTYEKWPDTCAGFVRPRPITIEMCYSGGTFTMAEENPPCNRFTGSMSYTGARRLLR